MTAFLFIPASLGSGVARRVDFGNIGSVFTECDAPVRQPGPTRALLRAAAAALFLLIAIGDTFMVARSGAQGGCPVPRAAHASPML